MPAPSFVAASNGTSVTTAGGNIAVLFSTSVSVGDIVIAHIVADATGNSITGINVGTNTQALDGTANSMTLIGSWSHSGTTGTHWLYIGRATTTTPAASFAFSGGADMYMRLYAFTGVASGTALSDVLENSTAGSVTNAQGVSVAINAPSVTTLGVDRLALAFVAVNDDNALDPFTGESGGDWTEAVAEYAEANGTDAALGLQIATIASAGTISGGSDSMAASDGWGVVGFALKPVPGVVGSTVSRFRADDGNETGATWLALADTAPTTITAGSTFRFRHDVRETSGGGTTIDSTDLQVQVNGGSWANVSAVTQIAETTSTHFSDLTATTQQITVGGSFTAGQLREDASLGTTRLSANQRTEHEFVLLVNGPTAGNTFALRVINATTSAVLYTGPTVTISAGGGGTAHSVSPSDTITLSDAITGKAIGLGRADTITLSDALTRVWVAQLSRADTITLTDVISKRPGKSLADTLTLSDLAQAFRGIPLSLSDTITLTDAIAKRAGLGRADTITLADALGKSVGLTRQDSMGLADAIGKAPVKSLADSIAITDAIARAWAASRSLADTITLSDATSKAIGLSKADVLTLLDDLTPILSGGGTNHTKTLEDQLVMSDAIGLGMTKAFADSITLQDALSQRYGMSRADALTLSDQILKTLTVSRSDTLTMADAVAKHVGALRADTITLADALGLAVSKVVDDAITMTDALSKAIGLRRSDIINIADAIVRELNGQNVDEAVVRAARTIFLGRFGIY